MTYGFLFNGEYSYLRSGIWNPLDLLILIFSYICLTPLSATFKFIKTFRILRALRLISRNEGLKVAVRALIFAIPNVFNITVIMIIFYMIFGVMAVSNYKGKMHYCDYTIGNLSTLVYSKWDCLNSGGLWINKPFNYDNIINALVILFTMSTTAGWGDMMY